MDSIASRVLSRRQATNGTKVQPSYKEMGSKQRRPDIFREFTEETEEDEASTSTMEFVVSDSEVAESVRSSSGSDLSISEMEFTGDEDTNSRYSATISDIETTSTDKEPKSTETETTNSPSSEQSPESEGTVVINGIRKSTRPHNQLKSYAPKRTRRHPRKIHKDASSNFLSSAKKNFKRSRSNADISEKEKEPQIYRVIGKRDPKAAPPQNFPSSSTKEFYYVAYTEKSNIHNSWVTREQLIATLRGSLALSKFETRVERMDLCPSSYLSSLLTFSDRDLQSDWFLVDRILDEYEDDESHEYFIKWRNLPYDEATWENAESVGDSDELAKYYKRLDISHPKNFSLTYKVDPKAFAKVTVALKSVNGDTLRDYQLEGLNWLLYCYYNSINSILADEMGLGKTVQIVATLSRISSKRLCPFLVIAPLSTLPHWRSEFETWSSLNAVIYHGSQKACKVIRETEFIVVDSAGREQKSHVQFDVLITNYDTFTSDFSVFAEIQWEYLVVDEAQRLKNYNCIFYQQLKKLSFHHCTLLTGTPIQNNTTELWSLLHFLNPAKFGSLADFEVKFGVITNASQVEEIQKIIQPIMLRRLKSNVDKEIAPKEETIIEVELTRVQKTYYRALIHENAPVLLKKITKGAINSLNNLMIQLRKVCNHPFLLKGAEEAIEDDRRKEGGDFEFKSLVESSGKLILVDKLLPKLKNDHHKVLIFSQWVKILDIIEDYIIKRKYSYERLDGGIKKDQRQTSIDRFNRSDDDFIFLLSTRAGGVGINLTSADTVIIFDSDWNPQNDVQAQARCHRIGQKKKVKVYRLITRGTYEEEMFKISSKKLGLDHAVLDGALEDKEDKPLKAKEIEEILRKGIHGIFDDDDKECESFCKEDIDQILERRAKVFVNDVISGGESILAKAKFDAEKDDLDLHDENFWSKVLPGVEETLNIIPDRLDRFADFRETQNAARNIFECGYKGGKKETEIITESLKFVKNEKVEQLIEAHQGTFDAASLSYIQFHAKKIIDSVSFFESLKKCLRQMQNKNISWPKSQAIWANPVMQYKFMYQLNESGWESVKKYEGALSSTRMKGVINTIIKEVEQSEAEEVKVLDSPEIWASKHEELTVRYDLIPDEIVKLFFYVKDSGVPLNKANLYDYDAVLNNLKFPPTTLAKMKFALDSILSFVGFHSDPRIISINFARYPMLQCLADQIKLSDLREASLTIAEMGTIRRCANAAIDVKFVSTAAPKWWTAPHSLGLVNAISKYGPSLFSSWIADEVLPFRATIPKEMIAAFDEASAKEANTSMEKKPKGCDTFLLDFRWLWTREDRIREASYIASGHEKYSKPSNGKNMTTQHIIVSIGKIDPRRAMSNESFVFPDGFVSERMFTFPESQVTKFIRCEVVELADGSQEFIVTLPNDGMATFRAGSAAEAWDMMLDAVQKQNKIDANKEKRKTNGPLVFGILSSNAFSQILGMRRQIRMGASNL